MIKNELTSKASRRQTLSYQRGIRKISLKISVLTWILTEAMVTSESYTTKMYSCITHIIKKDVIGYIWQRKWNEEKNKSKALRQGWDLHSCLCSEMDRSLDWSTSKSFGFIFKYSLYTIIIPLLRSCTLGIAGYPNSVIFGGSTTCD